VPRPDGGDGADADRRTLERLLALARRLFAGRLRAFVPPRDAGASLEFEEHRRYGSGDDLRTVDWNVYRRLSQVVVKRFRAERDGKVALLVDASGSMRVGHPPKLAFAQRIARAIGYLSLHLYDELRLGWLPADAQRPFAAYRGRGRIGALFADLARPPESASGDVARDLRDLLACHGGRGRAIVVGDFCGADPGGALGYLAARRLPVDVVHVVAPDELELPPELDGAVHVLDAEADHVLELELDPRARQAYAALVHEHLDLVRSAALRRRLAYHRVSTAAGLEDTLQSFLATGAFLS